ncbi:uroporphyrinogen-III C-methyltransferase [Corynebacterium sp. B5-R-101]|uniref:uroporphyrinogen-III C-methyltransferase n=1 Tax=Corynebacterium intestinale TaxID=2943492 RepID=A0ABT0TBA3_9CORY|nr:uroporphyrinogen-III C-methyltransferase [Corynebacterium intestinale]MCL8494364.1 uroporphyrinogen-III C-methyltransferase [Corynebacterium intestinale]MCP1390600.1 uroporphyrinogen-III C-methyltransferase [Corynebacterium intestinale]
MSIHPVVLVGGGPGAWDLITVRGMRALQEAEVIVADHLGPTAQLDKLCDVDAKELIDVSKIPYRAQVAQERINEILIEHAQAGRRVVRLKGGDPYVFGRGFEELTALTAAGLPVEVIPGVTSAVAVPALAGTPVTHRGVVHAFTVVSGHLPPGHPKSLVDWAALARSGATLSVIMGVKNAAAIATALIDASLSPHTPVHIIQEGTLDGERAFHCELAELGPTMEENSVAPPAVIVIGKVAGL